MQCISLRTWLAVFVTGGVLAVLCSGVASAHQCSDSSCSSCQFCSLAIPACALGDQCPVEPTTEETPSAEEAPPSPVAAPDGSEAVLPEEKLLCPIAIELSSSAAVEEQAPPPRP